MKKTCALVLAMIMMLLCTAAGATTAADTNNTALINESKGIETSANTIRIAKEIVFINAEDTEVREPNITYTYTISSVTPDTADITDKNGNMGRVKAGPMGAVSSDEGVTAAFADTSAVSVAGGKTSAVKYAEFSFLPSGFTEGPGIYRYQIAETCSPAKAAVGIAEAAGYQANRYLDVYLKWNDARTALEIYGYVLFEGTKDTDIASTDVAMKSMGYVNTGTEGNLKDVDRYETQNLYIHKTTTGSMADTGHGFPVKIRLTAPTGLTQDVKMDAAAANGTIATGTAAWGETGGTVRNGTEISIKGIPAGASVQVTETNDTVDFYKIKAGTTAGGTDLAAEAIVQPGQSAAGTTVLTLDAKKDIYFTNTLDTISPTGYVMRFIPYALMLIGGIVLLVIARKHRKHTDED